MCKAQIHQGYIVAVDGRLHVLYGCFIKMLVVLVHKNLCYLCRLLVGILVMNFKSMPK